MNVNHVFLKDFDVEYSGVIQYQNLRKESKCVFAEDVITIKCTNLINAVQKGYYSSFYVV